MKCYSCGKNFDYEKYYGICPKCGCYNKKETAAEQHQQYHDQYDNGYRHTEHEDAANWRPRPVNRQSGPAENTAAPVYVQANVSQKKSGRGSTIFLLVSFVIFLVVCVGGTSFGMLYKKGQEKKLMQEVTESQTNRQEHAIGETFSFQDMQLTVKDAWTVDEGQGTNPGIPQGMKLVAVEIAGKSDGEWKDQNHLPDAYIYYDSSYYFWQIPYYEAYGNTAFADYDLPLFDPYALREDREAKGCLLFLVSKEIQDFTMSLEERVDENQIFIETIHSLEIHLDEIYLGGPENEQSD